MFVRIDTDLFVRVENISSYRILESSDSYKLQVWCSGILAHTVIYVKGNPNNIKLLVEFIEAMKDFIINPEVVVQGNIEPERHLTESIGEDNGKNE